VISLYDDQMALVEEIRQAVREGHKHIMLMAATGFGKTRTAAYIVEQALNKGTPTLFIADLKTLVDQSAIEFGALGLDGSVVMADDVRYAPWKNFHVCSAQTLMRRRPPDANVVIVDEAHTHYKYLTELMASWNKVIFIGLSATPFTRGLGKHWTKLIVGPSMAELISRGRLKQPVCWGPPTIDTKGLRLKGNDFDQKELAKRVRTAKITADIVDTYIKRGEGRKFICFPVNVDHSKDLVNGFNLAGIPCAHIDAYTKDEDRQRYYEQLNTGELMGLCSVGVLSKGFDEPSVSCAILAFATKSLMKYIQTGGRAARAHEGQTDYLLLDHGGNVDRFGYPDDPLPNFLCNGEKTEAARAKEREEEMKENDLLPKKCPDCSHMVKAKEFTCPGCGHLFVKKTKIEIEQLELEKLAKKETTAAGKRNRLTPPEVKQDFYSAAISHRNKNGYKSSWAACTYREYFGVWPNAFNEVAGGASIEFSNFLKHKNIRYAKSKARNK